MFENLLLSSGVGVDFQGGQTRRPSSGIFSANRGTLLAQSPQADSILIGSTTLMDLTTALPMFRNRISLLRTVAILMPTSSMFYLLRQSRWIPSTESF